MKLGTAAGLQPPQQSLERTAQMRNRETRIFFLCKFFGNASHASDFMNGRLYANKLSYFKSLEEPYQARSDPHEGIAWWGQPGMIKVEINGHDLSDDLAAPVSISLNRLRESNVVCMHAGHLEDSSAPPPEDLEQVRERLLIPEECKKFGQIAVVIKNVPELLNRIRIAAHSRGYGVAWALVKYYDPITFHGSFPGISGAFWKQAGFRSEREYRIVFETGSIGDEPAILDIGPIEDIAMLSTIDEINHNMKIQQDT